MFIHFLMEGKTLMVKDMQLKIDIPMCQKGTRINLNKRPKMYLIPINGLYIEQNINNTRTDKYIEKQI